MRVLDVDLDFFVDGVATMVSDDGPRLSDDDYRVCSIEEALAFLRDQCLVFEPLPGWVVEHHDEAFWRWRDAVRNGSLLTPFHITHIDAHADLGLGDAKFFHLINNVMYRPVEERGDPEVIGDGMTCGNWLTYAVACRWVSDIDYVFCPGGGSDLLGFHLSDDFNGIQLKAASEDELRHALNSVTRLKGEHRDPVVPLRQVRRDEFQADAPYDAIVLSRSPGFTPAAADTVFDALRHIMVDETAFSD